jgi:Flp pilus assembly protein TadD
MSPDIRYACILLTTILAGCADTGANDFVAGNTIAPRGEIASPSTAPSGDKLGEALDLEQRGQHRKAFAAVSAAYVAEPANPAVVVAYSRLALANGRADDASKAIGAAEAAGVSDWRLFSAKGVVLAEKGDLAGAKSALQKGLELAPEQSSLLNNLAFVYALDGEPKMAEDLLRRASNSSSAKPRTRQNLALVLGLQGKYDESKEIAAAETSVEIAESNIAYLKSLTETADNTKLAEAGGATDVPR